MSARTVVAGGTPKHTPGPWLVMDRGCGRLVIDSPSALVASVTFNDAAGKLDAALIAAAPDLLRALSDLLYWHDAGIGGRDMDAAESAARAAIAKAEGRS